MSHHSGVGCPVCPVPIDEHTRAMREKCSLRLAENVRVPLPTDFFQPLAEPLAPDLEILWCPNCYAHSFYEMEALYSDEKGYWCASCGVRVRKSELNEVIDKHLNGETRRVKINMEPKTLTLFARIRRAVSGFSWMR